MYRRGSRNVADVVAGSIMCCRSANVSASRANSGGGIQYVFLPRTRAAVHWLGCASSSPGPSRRRTQRRSAADMGDGPALSGL